MTHSLLFNMTLATSNTLVEGTLALTYPNGDVIRYLATSGCTQWQQPGDEWVRGKGPIPAGKYQIPAIPYHLETKGIEGDFFHITPDPVVSSFGVRSELGIHFDANMPGSAGCIVLRNQEGWKAFCDRLHAIAKLGVETILLTVNYSGN